MNTVALSTRDAATIRAALKLYQETYDDDANRAQNDFPEEFDEIEPLDFNGVEDLLLALQE